MRWVLVVVACGACNLALGLHEPVAADAILYTGATCDPLPFDRLRYRGIDGGTISSFTGFSSASALAECQALGMELVSFDDGDTMELANELSGAPFDYWTGLQYTTAGWANPDGCRPANLWRAGEPTHDDTSSCGLQTAENEVAGACGDQGFGTAGPILGLCETPRPSPDCLARWTAFPSAYRIPDLGNYTYVVAGSHCTMPREHVVVIDSSAELAIVTQFAASHGVQRYWIGATFSGTQWATVTNCPAVFPWDHAQPDFTTMGGNCAWTEAGQASSHGCNNLTETAQVICETD
jgi:hypothetical protein